MSQWTLGGKSIGKKKGKVMGKKARGVKGQPGRKVLSHKKAAATHSSSESSDVEENEGDFQVRLTPAKKYSLLLCLTCSHLSLQ